jgi:hypothetical protein
MDVELNPGHTEVERTTESEQRRRGRLPGPTLVRVRENATSEPGIRGGKSHGANGSLSTAMLDHILVDLITQTRAALENALLQRQAVEERFQVDVFLGDVSWETSYSLPGEDKPPRVRADLSLDWPTWSQSAYRSWSIGEPSDDLPEVVLEITLRVQRLAAMPDLDAVVACLPEESPAIGADTLVRAAPVVEQVYEPVGGDPRFAVETTYQGTLRLDEAAMDDASTLAGPVGALGRWVASVLVRLGDLDLVYLPPEAPTVSGEAH